MSEKLSGKHASTVSARKVGGAKATPRPPGGRRKRPGRSTAHGPPAASGGAGAPAMAAHLRGTLAGALLDVVSRVVAEHEGKDARAALREVRGGLLRLLEKVDRALVGNRRRPAPLPWSNPTTNADFFVGPEGRPAGEERAGGDQATPFWPKG